MNHGHRKSELRNLHLHHAAMEKLRREPHLREPCLQLVQRWLADPENGASHPWLQSWEQMLTSWDVPRMAAVVLDDLEGQTLRQCSPLGPVFSPRERWSLLATINAEFARTTT